MSLNYKPAIFMDAFLTDEKRHEIFNYNVSMFIKHGWDVFVFSNRIHHFGAFNGVKYFEYDSRNRVLLDRNRYDLPSQLMAYSTVFDETGVEYKFDAITPSHGFTNWTLLYNLRRMAEVAKKFGHTHFITCEYDIRFKNYDLLNTIFRGFGDTEKSKKCMIVKYGGFGCITNLYLISVELVLDLIPQMETEDDYEMFLRKCYGSAKSPVYEQLFWEQIVQYTNTGGAKNAELIPQEHFFENLEEWGVFISEGDLGLRQGIFYKNLVVTPVNNNTEFFIKYWGDTTHTVLVKYTIDTHDAQYITMTPGKWVRIPCGGAKQITVYTSESLKHSNTPLTFDLSRPCIATLIKVNN